MKRKVVLVKSSSPPPAKSAKGLLTDVRTTESRLSTR
jgi:hypothetical protein